MKIIKALRKRSCINKLNRLNIVRCHHAAFLMMFLSVFCFFMDRIITKKSTFMIGYWPYILVANIISVLLMVSTYFASNIRRSCLLFRMITDFYIIGTETTLFLMADKILKSSNHATLYITAVFFLAAVPVFYGIELCVAIISQILIMVVFVMSFKQDSAMVLTILVCNIISSVIIYRKYNEVCNSVQIEERLHKEIRVSEHDPMTGLLNRRGLDKKIKAIYPLCRRYKIPVGVIMLDIDEFKKYNDTYGHPQGDVCIQKVSEMLTKTAKRNTDVIARVGGEEFLIFVQEMKKDELMKLAELIQKNVEAMRIMHAPNASHKNVTVSIGLGYTNPKDGMSFEALYKDADQELYLAKKSGRNCIGIDHRIAHSEAAMRRAVAK